MHLIQVTNDNGFKAMSGYYEIMGELGQGKGAFEEKEEEEVNNYIQPQFTLQFK